MKHQTKGVLLATTTAMLWGALAIALKVALNYFDAYTIVWFRFLVATISLVIFFTYKQPTLLHVFKKPPWMMLAAAVCLGFNYIGFMQGVNLAGPAATQIIIQTGPIMLGFVGFVFFKESINLTRAVGFTVAAAGFAIFYAYQLGAFDTDRSDFTTGVAWIIFGALSWTTYAIFNKKLVVKYPPQQVNLIVFALPVILFLPFVNFTSFIQPHEWWVWVLMVTLGLNTVVAYGTLAASFKYTEANKISIIVTLNPIITFVLLEVMMNLNLQWFEFKTVPAMAYLGALLVLVGAIFAIGIKRKKLSSSK